MSVPGNLREFRMAGAQSLFRSAPDHARMLFAGSDQLPSEKGSKKNWLQRLLNPEPPEPRRAPRESLQGLAAYFYTGGKPVPQVIRDISSTGMYILTSERWYIGTTLRMTLTDSRNPSAERSITLNATVVRSGNDGVGLRYVYQSSGKPGSTLAGDSPVEVIDKQQIEQFLQRYREGDR